MPATTNATAQRSSSTICAPVNARRPGEVLPLLAAADAGSDSPDVAPDELVAPPALAVCDVVEPGVPVVAEPPAAVSSMSRNVWSSVADALFDDTRMRHAR